MNRILLVEDNSFLGSMVKKKIETKLGFDVTWTLSYNETVELIENDSEEPYFISILDLNLPDAAKGKIVDYVLSKNIPVIVFTGDMSDNIRDYIWSKEVVDYVLKEGVHNIDYLIALISRFRKNKSIRVMIVDDSEFSRNAISSLLKIHNYDIVQAENGEKALELLDKNPEIRMAVIDYHMPTMNGIELTRTIRQRYKKEELSIIGVSAQGNQMVSARFIKNGANDFIIKPFLTEEFFCRITQNMEMLDQFELIKNLSNKDYLSDLYNRRYFFELGRKLFENALRKNIGVVIAMLDIDHFKKINDTYGHDVGDAVIRKFSKILKTKFRKSDVVARIGGEEFCVLATNMSNGHIKEHFEGIRNAVEHTPISIGDLNINITVSIGISKTILTSFDEMIKISDQMLYKAKNRGRNRVMLSAD